MLNIVEDPSNKKDPKFKVGENVRISKYKNIFAKGYTPNGLMLLVIWMVKKLLKVFMKKNCKRLIKKNLE